MTWYRFLAQPPGPSRDDAIQAITWDGLATIIAAGIAAVVVFLGYLIQQGLARRERRATVYGEALRAVEDYLEAPYRVRRKDRSDSTWQDLVTHVSDVQSRLDGAQRISPVLLIEAPQVAGLG